jgi:Flagellar hook-length control protein FliK
METLPIQLAGTAAPTGSASPTLGTPTAGDSFASKFGRVLAGMSESGQDRASTDLNAPSRTKSAPENGSDSAAMVVLNCLAISLIEPPSHLPNNTEAAEPAISGQPAATESSADSLSNFASSLNVPTDEAGANATKPSLPPSVGAKPTGEELPDGSKQSAVLVHPLRAGKDTLPTVTAKSGSERSAAMLATPEQNKKVATASQNSSADAVAAASAGQSAWLPGLQGAWVSNPPAESIVGAQRSESNHEQIPPVNVLAAAPSSGPTWFNGLHGNPGSSHSAEPTVQVAQTESNSLDSLAPPLVQDAGPRQDSQAAFGFTNSGTPVDTPGLAPVPAAPAQPSREDLPALSDSILPTGETNTSTALLGQVEQATAVPFLQASAPSTAPIADGQDGLAEFSAAMGKSSIMEMNVKVSKNGTTVGTALNEQITAGNDPAPIGAPQNSPGKIAGELVQSLIAPNAESTVHSPAQTRLDLPSTDSSDVAGRKPFELETAAGNANPPIVPPYADPSDQFASNSPTAAPGITLQNDVTQGSNAAQSSVFAAAGSTASNSHGNAFDTSTGSQGKSGRQNAPGSGDGPATTFIHGIAISPGPDPAGSLLTAHTPSIPASHTITSTPPEPPSSSAAQHSTTLSAWQNYDGGAGRIVRSASLTESASGAEMHVELRSGPMGPIEVHTVVHDGSVGAEIHVQGPEAHSLLAAGLPSLERALTDRNLRVENIAVYQDHTGGGIGGGGRQDSSSDSPPSPHQPALP